MTGPDPGPDPDPAKPRTRSDLATRMIFGPSMLALVGGVYWMDTVWTAGFASATALGLLAVGGVLEYVWMMRGAGRAVAPVLLPVFTALLCASFLLPEPWLFAALPVATFGLLFTTALSSLRADRMKAGLELQGATMLGFVWIAWPLFAAQCLALWHLPSVLYVLLISKGGDIGGYFLGRLFGRHKLIPHVSKGKTVEGSLGSLLASCAVAAALWKTVAHPAAEQAGLTAAIGIGIMLNLGTQTGDLAESLLKRSCGVKDSSGLLPAHGGILDLVDSLLFAFPPYFILLVLLNLA